MNTNNVNTPIIISTLLLAIVGLCPGNLYGQLLSRLNYQAGPPINSVLSQPYFSTRSYAGTGSLGMNIPTLPSYQAATALDLWLRTTDDALRRTTPFSTAKFTYVSKPNNPSYIHYSQYGDWVVQSSYEDQGTVFIQPRGGIIQLGATDTDVANPRTKATPGSQTHVKVHADTSTLYGEVIVRDPAAPTDRARGYSLHSTLQRLSGPPNRIPSFVENDIRQQDRGRKRTRIIGINISPRNQGVLDVLSHSNGSGHPAPSARFQRTGSEHTPSYIHYLRPGHWVIQSVSSNSGTVYLQPRGGLVQVGSTIDPRTASSEHAFISSLYPSTLDIHAQNTHIHGNLLLYDRGTPVNVLTRIRSIPPPSQIQVALGFQGLAMGANAYVDYSPPDQGYIVRPSGRSKVNTLNVSILKDNEDQRFVVDLDKTSMLNNVILRSQFDISGLVIDDGPSIFYGNIQYTFRINADNLLLGSNHSRVQAKKVITRRRIKLNSTGKVKLNILANTSDSAHNGIYFNDHAALTVQDAGASSLVLNAGNTYTQLHIGNPSRSDAQFEVNGRAKLDRKLHTRRDITVQGNINVGDDIFVDGNAIADGQFLGYGSAPIGAIVMWQGSTIPDGWAICDGRNGTPNLRDRFILGYEPPSRRRILFITRRDPGMPVNGTGGRMSVSLNERNIPRHRHRTWGERDGFAFGTYGGRQYYGSHGGMDGDNRYYYTSYTGGGSPIDIRPRYYALAFIMRIR